MAVVEKTAAHAARNLVGPEACHRTGKVYGDHHTDLRYLFPET